MGGGVEVEDSSVFTMKGGTISGNIPYPGLSGGGGVDVTRSSVFTMEGGTISGNTREKDGLGAVCVWEGSTFIMKSGAITGNNARGVFTNSATFIMEGGEISGNKGSGATIHTRSKATMSGGAIYGNTSQDEGGGVFILADSFFTMTGGRIQGNTDSDGFTKNTARQGKNSGAALWLVMSTAKWGTGGAYTRGGASQTGGSDIVPVGDEVGTNDTLIAVPGR
jgi:hypothetical protein